MLDSNPLLNNLRRRPPRTRTVIAVIAALIPTLAVSYAQFYMRARNAEQQVAAVGSASDTKDVSIFEAIGKIFDEGKSTVGKSVDTLKQLNTSVLDSVPISASSSDMVSNEDNNVSAQSPATSSDVVQGGDNLDLGTAPSSTPYDATITKSFAN